MQLIPSNPKRKMCDERATVHSSYFSQHNENMQQNFKSKIKFNSEVLRANVFEIKLNWVAYTLLHVQLTK